MQPQKSEYGVQNALLCYKGRELVTQVVDMMLSPFNGQNYFYSTDHKGVICSVTHV